MIACMRIGTVSVKSDLVVLGVFSEELFLHGTADRLLLMLELL